MESCRQSEIRRARWSRFSSPTRVTQLVCTGLFALASVSLVVEAEARRLRSTLPPHPATPIQLAQGSNRVDLRIPAQALSDALTAFSAQMRLQVLYEGIIAEGLRSPGISGTYTPEEALQRLLADTGLTYRFTTPTR
jgi:hypothetical protein